jgi:hypothetical protein
LEEMAGIRAPDPEHRPVCCVESGCHRGILLSP